MEVDRAVTAARQDVVERTLVLIKPDAVRRGLTGKNVKMVTPTRDFAARHYPNTPEWIEGMGKKTLETYRDRGIDPIAEVGTDDPMKIGEMVKEWNVDYLSSGPVVAVVLEGLHAIAAVRKLCGNTMPLYAEPGSIRGTYSSTSAVVANSVKGAVRNLVHASSNPAEVAHETDHWFGDKGVHQYRRTDEDAIY